MKKIIFILLLISVANVASAKIDVKINISEDIEKDCKPLTNINGCFIPDENQIYISTETNNFASTFYHEIGHYFMHRLPESKLRSIYPEINKNASLYVWEEVLATMFSRWMTYNRAFSQIEIDFFNSILKIQ
jgi:Zn-dependent peptidase ImmA (M78 family)